MPSPGQTDFFTLPSSQKRKLIFSFVSSTVLLVTIMTMFRSSVFSDRYMPHAFCYLEKPALVWTHVAADTVIGLSYVAIAVSLGYLVFKGRKDIPFRWMFLAFGLFIVACGGTHFVETVTVWIPVYVFSAGVKLFTAIASLCTAVALPFYVPDALNVVREAKRSEKRREELELVLAQRNEAQQALRQLNTQLENQVEERTAELNAAVASLEAQLQQRKKLEASVARLAAIVESSNDAIVSKDLDGTIRSWNGGAERLYGYTAEEVIGKNIQIICPQNRSREMLDILSRVKHGDRIRNFETERVNKSGFLIDVSLTVSPVFDEAGHVVGASAIGRDITTAKRAQDALRESEAQYRLLFDRSPLPMWIFDQKTLKFLAVNQAAVDHYGYSREEFFRMTVLDIRPLEDAASVLKEMAIPEAERKQRKIWRHRKKDGSIINVEITSRDLTSPTPTSELVLAHDVTQRLQSETRLLQSEERFSKAFRSSPFGITISTENEGRYVDANPAFLSIMGYERDELVGKTVHDLHIWSEPHERALLLQQLDHPKPTKSVEAHFRAKSGKIRLVEMAAERIVLDDKHCVLAIIQDITEARQLEQQFLQAQKMEAVGRLAAGLAHDFNNMLGVIIGYADIARERLDPDQAAQKHLAEIRKASERAAGLVRQLLVFTRQQQQVPRVLNLNSIVKNLNNMLVHVLGEDIAFELELTEPLGSVRVDLGQMEQVLMNLAVNARDAMPKGGQFLIETSNVDLDEKYIGQQGPVKPGSYVLLAVSDNGTGMDEVALSRAFEPFFTTKEPGKGTGLGLATVWGIIKQSNGYISVYSDMGHGTTFKIYLPRVDQPAENLVPTTVNVSPRSGHETVLLVEDDSALRVLAANVLEGKGYNVLSAPDGSLAIDFAAQFEGEIALLLTDVIMPGMTGPELANELKKVRPGLKTLYMSGYSGNLLFRGGISGNLAVLSKPFSSLDLLTKVRSVLDEKPEENKTAPKQ